MKASPKQDIKARFKRDGVKYVDLKYPTLLGTLNHITVPVNRFDEIMVEGVGADGSSLPGFKTVEKGDMLIYPDTETYFIDPFFEEKTAAFLCSVYTPKTMRPFERDARGIAQRATAYLERTLHATALFQPELEFYLLETCECEDGPGLMHCRIAATSAGSCRMDYPLRYKGGYHAGPPEDRFGNFRNAVVELLASCGVPAKYHHHEVGSQGQLEIEMVMEPLLKSADGLMLSKYLIKSLAQRTGRIATFMPKPYFGEPGSGMHFHQYLTKRGRSIFYDEKAEGNLSDVCRNYIAGILRHSRALCALTNPSTNSYRRLIPGYEAPTYTDFSLGNRTSAIRVPTYIVDTTKFDIEYRIPDATCNPYVAMSAILLAGIDGIKRDLKPDVRERLPRDAFEALDALRDDHEFLFQGETFDQGLIDRFLEIKRAEYEQVQLRPHPYEFILYLGL